MPHSSHNVLAWCHHATFELCDLRQVLTEAPPHRSPNTLVYAAGTPGCAASARLYYRSTSLLPFKVSFARAGDPQCTWHVVISWKCALRHTSVRDGAGPVRFHVAPFHLRLVPPLHSNQPLLAFCVNFVKSEEKKTAVVPWGPRKISSVTKKTALEADLPADFSGGHF
jgi:hypothetical protein